MLLKQRAGQIKFIEFKVELLRIFVVYQKLPKKNLIALFAQMAFGHKISKEHQKTLAARRIAKCAAKK